MVFVPARRTPQRDVWTSGEDFDTAGAEKTAKTKLRLYGILQSSELGSLRPGPRREKLTVLAPRRFSLLARTPVTQRSNDSI
jgi:hypothetical protein